MQVSDVQLLLAAPQASGGYVQPGSVYNSNGKWCSTTQLDETTTLDNLFPDLTGVQNAVQQVDYQCLFVFNTTLTSTMTNVVAWLPTAGLVSPGAVDWAVGADTTLASAYNATTGPSGVTQQAGYITSPGIAPSTVSSWVGPVAEVSDGGATMPDIGPQQVAALWIQRTATGYVDPGGNSVTAGFNLQVTFDVLSGG